jgi:hypothetical protein
MNLIFKRGLVDFADLDHQHQLTMTKSTSVDVKSERMRSSLADFRRWPWMAKRGKKTTKAALVISTASETVPGIS